MEFFIKKNATLPLLKMQVVKDGRSDYNHFMDMIEVSSLFFSMTNIETGIPKILSRPAGFVEKILVNPDADPEYYIYYQFTNLDTNSIGRFEGQFMLKNDDGVLILPIREKLFINISESFIADDLPYDSCYVIEFPCCVNPLPSPTVPAVTQSPTPTPTPTPSTTPIPPPPANDFYYIILPNGNLGYVFIPDGDINWEELGPFTLTLYPIVYPGSVIFKFILVCNYPIAQNITLDFTESFGLVTGGTINVSTSVTIPSGQTSGETIVTLNNYNYNDLDLTYEITGATVIPSGLTVGIQVAQTQFDGPTTPTPTPTISITPTTTPSETVTPTPTPTPSPALLPSPKILLLGDSDVTSLELLIKNKFSEKGYEIPIVTSVEISTTYDGSDLNTSNYDVVLLYTNSFETGLDTTFPNNLQNYINSGGNLITGTFLWNLYPVGFNFTLTPFVPTYSQTNDPTGNFTNIVSHPITDGLPSSSVGFKLTNGMLSLQSNAELISTYDTSGQPFIAINEINYTGRIVGINAYLLSTDNTFITILTNSLLWASSFIDPVIPTPTPTPTPTETLTPTPTPTETLTPTPTPTSVVGSLFEMKLFESGSDVIMSGTGKFITSDLTFGFTGNFQSLMRANLANFISGDATLTSCDNYTSITTVPSNFGTGGQFLANSGSGDKVGILYLGPSDYRLLVPTGYVSNTTLTTLTTYTGKTLSSLGCTVGTYTWSWGSGSNAGTLILTVGN